MWRLTLTGPVALADSRLFPGTRESLLGSCPSLVLRLFVEIDPDFESGLGGTKEELMYLTIPVCIS
jgi:hypothetical protein